MGAGDTDSVYHVARCSKGRIIIDISLVDKCSIAAGRNRDTGYCDAICGGDGWCRLQSAVNKQLHGIRNVSEWVQGDSFRGIRCKAVSTEIVIDGQIAKGCCAGIDNTENISDTVAGGISVRKRCFRCS